MVSVDMRGNNSRRLVQLCWAGMDGFFILYYLQGSVRRGEVPYLTEINNIVALSEDHGSFALVMGSMSLISHLSIFVSCMLFAYGYRAAYYLAMLQVPFRLLFMTPSISTLLLWPKLIPAFSPWLMLALIVGSEGVKAWSLWWLCRAPESKQRESVN